MSVSLYSINESSLADYTLSSLLLARIISISLQFKNLPFNQLFISFIDDFWHRTRTKRRIQAIRLHFEEIL